MLEKVKKISEFIVIGSYIFIVFVTFILFGVFIDLQKVFGVSYIDTYTKIDTQWVDNDNVFQAVTASVGDVLEFTVLCRRGGARVTFDAYINDSGGTSTIYTLSGSKDGYDYTAYGTYTVDTAGTNRLWVTGGGCDSDGTRAKHLFVNHFKEIATSTGGGGSSTTTIEIEQATPDSTGLFAIGIVLVLIFVMFTGYLYNKMTVKKPWE